MPIKVIPLGFAAIKKALTRWGILKAPAYVAAGYIGARAVEVAPDVAAPIVDTVEIVTAPVRAIGRLKEEEQHLIFFIAIIAVIFLLLRR